MELYKKYRPKSIKTIIGNTSVLKAIKGFKEFPHAILLTGPSGCGKTSLGRIIAKMIGSKGMDYVELDTAVFRGIDTVRDIRQKMTYKPIESKARVWLIDEIHSLGVGGSSEKNIAQNALLKMLEDPPEHVYFILCTTNPEMLIPTVKGRCTSFEMKTLMNDEMETLLTRICKKEKKGIPDPVKDQIIQDAEGHPRNALNILDKVLVLDDEDEMLEMAKQEGLKTNAIKDLCYALLDGKEWKNIQSILKGIRTEQPETIRRAILGMMGSAILDGWGDHKKVDAWGIMSWFYEKPTYDCGFAGITFCCKAITDGQACPYGG